MRHRLICFCNDECGVSSFRELYYNFVGFRNPIEQSKYYTEVDKLMYSSKLHIFIYSTLSVWGGGRETWLRYFLKRAVNDFEEIHVYFLGRCKNKGIFFHESIPFQFQQSYRIIWHPIHANNYLTWILKVVKLANFEIRNNDILLAVGSGPEAIAGMIVARFTNQKLIVWLRSVLQKELLGRKSSFFAMIAGIVEKFVLKSAALIIANGFDTKYHYQKILDCSKKIVVIPNALENEFLIKTSQLSLPRLEKPIKIAHIGRFVKERGSEYFISLAKMLEKDDRFQFEVWGPSYGLENSIHLKNLVFRGQFLPEMLPSILSKIDIALFLLPSRAVHGGGISHAILEAMSAKRLIIAWRNDVCTQHDSLLNEENSILCTEGDLNQVVFALNEVTEFPEKFIHKCLKAREKSALFTENEHYKLFLDVIRNFLESI